MTAPVVIGSATGTGASTITLTTTVDAPAGSTLVLATFSNILPVTSTGVANDSASNAYLNRVNKSNSGAHTGLSVWDSQNITHLPIGGTIVITFTGSSFARVVLFCIPDALAASFDIAGTTSGNTTGTSTTRTTGILNKQPATVFSFLHNRSDLTGFTDDAAFTNLSTFGTTIISYKAVTATTSVSWAVSWTNSQEFEAVSVAYDTVSGAISVALTGIGASLGQGSLVADADLALTGQAATLGQGNLLGALSAALSGQAATGAQGTLAAASSAALAGIASILGQGSVAAKASLALAGQLITSTAGNLGIVQSIALIGQVITSAIGTITGPTISIILSIARTLVILFENRTLTVAPEARQLSINSENRTIVINPEDRTDNV